MKVDFKKPHKFEEEEFNGIDLNLENLTGEDLATAEKELTAMGIYAVSMQTNQTALMLLAAKSAKVPVEMIKSLPINEASKVTMAVQNFLIG